MSPKIKPGDCVRIKGCNAAIDESDMSPLHAESTLKTDHIGRRKMGDVLNRNEAVLVGCSVAVENVLTYGPKVAPSKGDSNWTYAVEHAVAKSIIFEGMRKAISEVVPFGSTFVIHACGDSEIVPTGGEYPIRCKDVQCDRCYPKEPRWGVVCNCCVDGKMGMEKVMADEEPAPIPAGS